MYFRTKILIFFLIFLFLRADKSSHFSMSLGNLLPKSTVTIKLKYIAQLKAQDGKLRFELPLTHVRIGGEGEKIALAFIYIFIC